MSKVIITCAVTGAVHTPTMSPYLPITPEEIARQALDAVAAGAAIVHLHARDPQTGRPTPSPEIFQQFLPRIKAGCDAVINITTGGGKGMSIEDRTAAARAAQPEMASLNMGSLNFGFYELAKRYHDWKFDWERPFLESTKSWIFQNTFEDIEWILKRVGEECGTRFEFECYDVGHLYTLAHFLDRGLIKPPMLVQTIFGVHGGIGAHFEDLLHQKRTADRLFGRDYFWSILAIGRHQMQLAAAGALMGGNVRVGLEDSLYISKGELATSNAEQVRKISRILHELGLAPATPAEARAMLQLKGANQVAF